MLNDVLLRGLLVYSGTSRSKGGLKAESLRGCDFLESTFYLSTAFSAVERGHNMAIAHVCISLQDLPSLANWKKLQYRPCTAVKTPV
jgi:hypothetical protein